MSMQIIMNRKQLYITNTPFLILLIWYINDKSIPNENATIIDRKQKLNIIYIPSLRREWKHKQS